MRRNMLESSNNEGGVSVAKENLCILNKQSQSDLRSEPRPLLLFSLNSFACLGLSSLNTRVNNVQTSNMLANDTKHPMEIHKC